MPFLWSAGDPGPMENVSKVGEEQPLPPPLSSGYSQMAAPLASPPAYDASRFSGLCAYINKFILNHFK